MSILISFLKFSLKVTEDGKYSLVLVFEAKALQLSDFEQRQVDAPFCI